MYAQIFFKGSVLQECIGRPEGMQVQLDEKVILLTMRQKNIDRYPLGGDFEFRFYTETDIAIFILMRYGNTPWLSAPYTPHLAEKFEEKKFAKGEGIVLNVLQICNDNGIISNISCMALTTDFSNRLYRDAEMIYQCPFNPQEYDKAIEKIYRTFRTDEELAEHCSPECRCVIR